jgi:hypothetical protein
MAKEQDNPINDAINMMMGGLRETVDVLVEEVAEVENISQDIDDMAKDARSMVG